MVFLQRRVFSGPIEAAIGREGVANSFSRRHQAARGVVFALRGGWMRVDDARRFRFQPDGWIMGPVGRTTCLDAVSISGSIQPLGWNGSASSVRRFSLAGSSCLWAFNSTTGRAIIWDMHSKAQTTRGKILHEGLHLLSAEGLEGVTLGRLAEQVGMSKSGLFAHFRSKDEVQIELLEHSVQVAGAQVLEPAMAKPIGLPRVVEVMRRWFGWSKRAGLPGGCPVAAGMFELDDTKGPVRDKVFELAQTWQALLVNLVCEAIEQKHLRRDLDAEQFVWELSGIYLSHHTAYRFLRAADADRRAETAIRSLLERAGAKRIQRGIVDTSDPALPR